MEEKKILVGAPTSRLHDYIIDRYIDCINSFTYPNFDVLLIDNSEGQEFYQRLLSLTNGNKKWTIAHIEPEKNVFETLVKGFNMLIEHAIDGGYDYLFIVSTDTLPPAFSIERLMDHDKDIVGFLCHAGFGERQFPVVLKDGYLIKGGKRGLNYYTWDEIKEFNGLTKVWGTALSPCLIKRKVLETGIRFKYTPYFGIGEDIWFMIGANSAGFEFWLDPLRVTHENTDWRDKQMAAHKVSFKKRINKISKEELSARLCRLELMIASLIRRLKEKKVID